MDRVSTMSSGRRRATLSLLMRAFLPLVIIAALLPPATSLAAIGTATKLRFSSSPVTTPAGSTSSLITVQTTANNNQPVVSGSNVSVALTSDAPSGVFRNAADTSNITSVTIPSNASSADFRYRDTVVGTPTIQASNLSLNSGTQIETITAGSLDHITISPSAATITAGGSQTYTAQGFDANNNSLGSVTSSTTFSISPNGSCTGATCTASVSGTHTVTGTNAGKTATASLTVESAVAQPSISSFTPTIAQVGKAVTITGSGFTGATSVKFNGIAVSSFTVVSNTQITTAVPFGATTGRITVTTPGGTATSGTNFKVKAAIVGFTPTRGPVGTVVTISGSAFTGATAVKFGGVPATSFTVNSYSQITATVPSGAVSGRVGVVTPAGTTLSGATFTVTTVTVAKPVVSGFTPTLAQVGKAVTITGSGFNGATSVKFDTTEVGSFTVVSDTQITTTVPFGATTGKISVTTPGGTGVSSTNFKVRPAITGFTPTSGPVGTVVTISGSAFKGATTVKFGGVPATSFTVNSYSQITATVPSGAVTGKIAVITPAAGGFSLASFKVTP